MAALSLRSSRRLSLAPTQAKSFTSPSDEEGASLLMEMSLADLQKSTPAKGKRAELKEADLDKLSQEELEVLAWEAVEQEKRLKERVSKCKTKASKELDCASNTGDPMKHVTVRQKSNSPRKTIHEEILPALPKAETAGVVPRYTYDRQASPTRSAMKRPQTRKSVAFGVVAEYEISREGSELLEGVQATETSAIKAVGASSSSSDVRSSSPLARFNASSSAPSLPKVKSTNKATKGPTLTRRSSLRNTTSSSSSAADGKKPSEAGPSRKTSSRISPKSPIAKTRLQSAVQESSAKARAKARENAIKAKAKGKGEVQVPNGFRLSSTGTLLAQTKCDPFSSSVTPLAPRSNKGRLSNSGKVTQATKANPVPAWMKRRKEALLKVEDEELQRELQRVRAEELGQGESKSSEKMKARQATIISQQPAFTSAVEKRINERAVWEAKRKAKEDLVAEEKEKARRERTNREEAEYRQARQRSIPRANPVPDYYRTRRVQS